MNDHFREKLLKIYIVFHYVFLAIWGILSLAISIICLIIAIWANIDLGLSNFFIMIIFILVYCFIPLLLAKNSLKAVQKIYKREEITKIQEAALYGFPIILFPLIFVTSVPLILYLITQHLL